MKKKTNMYFVWNLIPIIIILLIASVVVTWQITYNYVTNEMIEQTNKILATERTQINKVAQNDYTIGTSDISGVISEVDYKIRSMYYGEIDEKKLMDYAIAGYIYGLEDRFATYYTAEDWEEYNKEKLEGKKLGLGITCSYDTTLGGLYVIDVYSNTPAEKSGIAIGEVITYIDGVSVMEMGYTASLASIGSKNIGDVVKITIKSTEGTERVVDITLEEFDVETVSCRMLTEDIGLIGIREFSATTPDEFKQAIAQLTTTGADKFIFDVRNNPGGHLDSIVTTLDFILPEGNIITTIYKDEHQENIVSDKEEFSSPMVVLVNGSTASAAELFTAGLRDYDKAKIVGETTYGKGSMQSIIENLPGGGAASVTVGVYLPPNGISYDGIGIVPDYEVVLPESVYEHYNTMTDEEDVQLQKAIEIISQMQTTVIQ